VYAQTGTLTAVDREIDPKTGTIRLSAVFPNRNQTLRPGQYGRVRAETRAIDGALLVPQRAVTEIQGTYQVRLVGAGNKAQIRLVKVGERVGSRWIIAEGLQAGDRVILEGSSIKDGESVAPTPAARVAAAAPQDPATGKGE
jgi:membrane fusion protein (multidrug efflux system)